MNKFYIYKTTNLINNKIYIGYHVSDDIQNDNYLGSGDKLKLAIKKYGKHNFSREILFEFNSFEEMISKEKEIVNEEFLKRDDVYNVVRGGGGCFKFEPIHNKDKVCIYSPITDKLYYIEKSQLQEFIESGWKYGNNTKGDKNCIEKDGIIKYVRNYELSNWLSNGWVKSNTTKDKICVTKISDGSLRYIYKDLLEDYLKNGFVIGNLQSGVNKNKIYITKDEKNKLIFKNQLNEFLNNGWLVGKYQKSHKIKRMYNPNTGELKNIKINECDDYVKLGWIYGVNYKSSNQYSIYITKNGTNKRISAAELDVYLNDGWKRGMFNKKYKI
jgi:hypothetical protein